MLTGENVSPTAAPWTVLVPGAEGEIVSAVQAALIAADVAVAGGADGAYGNDTMAAVAEYQRSNGALQVTGAVDVATARALGVSQDATVENPTTTTPATTAPRSAQIPTVGELAEQTDRASTGGRPRWVLVTAAAVIALAAVAAAAVGRRRHVVKQRAARRRARVHPATSPGRSIAKMRRAEAVDNVATPAGQGHDQQLAKPR